jgi:hypothetical protein
MGGQDGNDRLNGTKEEMTKKSKDAETCQGMIDRYVSLMFFFLFFYYMLVYANLSWSLKRMYLV